MSPVFLKQRRVVVTGNYWHPKGMSLLLQCWHPFRDNFLCFLITALSFSLVPSKFPLNCQRIDKTDSSTTALPPETRPACILVFQPAPGFSSTALPCPAIPGLCLTPVTLIKRILTHILDDISTLHHPSLPPSTSKDISLFLAMVTMTGCNKVKYLSSLHFI